MPSGVAVVVAIDLVRVSYISLAGQYAIDEAVRWGAIGSTLPGMTREASIKETLKRISAGYSMPVDLSGVKICRLSLADPLCIVESAGNPGEPFAVQMSYNTRLLFGGINFSLSFLSVGTNEEYAAVP